MKIQTLESLVENLLRYGERPALGLRQEFGARWWSYRHLYEQTFHVAALLREQQIQPGEHILLWAANCPEWVAVLLGASLRGVIVVPVDADASIRQIQWLMKESRTTLLFHGEEQDVSAIDVASCALCSLGRAPLPSPDPSLIVPVEPDAPVVVLYTSGTTMQPKGVILTQRNLAAQINHFRRWRWLLYVFPIRMLMLSPLSHVQGLMLGICIPLSIGLSVLYSYSVDPAHVIRTINHNRVSLLVAVPRLQRLLAQTLRQMPYGDTGLTVEAKANTIRSVCWRRFILFRSMRVRLGRWFWVLLVGGATLPRSDEYFWYECGYFLAHGYGLTETAAIVSVNLNTPFFAPKGSIGRPVAEQIVRLAGDGEILVRGTTITPGYAGHTWEDAEAFTDDEGFLHTGDLAQRDRKGRLFFLGRKKEIIVTGEGFNVYPQDVEAVLQQVPQVQDAVVIGLERAGIVEVHAVLLLGKGVDTFQVIRQANEWLEPHQRVRSWTVWPDDDFPRTNLFKARRQEIAATVQQASNGRNPDQLGREAPLNLEMILGTGDRGRRLDLLAHYLAETAPQQLESTEAQLVHDLGLSSLDVAELLTLIERRQRVVLGDIAISDKATLADLHAVAQGHGSVPVASQLPTQQPGWSQGPMGDLLPALVRPLVIRLWSMLYARPQVTWQESVSADGSFIVAAAPHRHWFDAFLICAALPRHLRKRLMVVTNRDFGEFFAPSPEVRWMTRIAVGVAYYLMPLLFRFAILSGYGTIREGLYEIGRLLDRGYCPLMFPKGIYIFEQDARRHDPGAALLAIQTQTPILPIWLEGNSDFRLRRRGHTPRYFVHIGEPIAVTPQMTMDELVDKVQFNFDLLALYADAYGRTCNAGQRMSP